MVIHQLVLHRYTSPIQYIINAIRHYQKEKGDFPLPIAMTKSEEFNQLAYTLNSLTERVKNQIDNLTSQRKETEAILETLNEGIIATDTSAQITFMNRSAARMLNTDRESSLGHILSLDSELSKKCHELILTTLQTSEELQQTWTVRDKDLTHLNLQTSLLVHQQGALLVIQDKTPDYRVIEMGKDFVANASHELRTPITIIRGFAETLQDNPDFSKEMCADITGKIVRTCGRLDKLVRSLLTLTDIEQFSPDRLKEADLVSLAENCEHLLFAAHREAKVLIKSNIEKAPILADPDLMELAILNLLENSVKYSQSSSPIEMHIDLQGEQVLLSVKDFGKGIAAADLPHIFDRFYTADKARSRKSGGVGLGLSIVQTIVGKHKGLVAASSELGKESVFTITLPLRKMDDFL